MLKINDTTYVDERRISEVSVTTEPNVTRPYKIVMENGCKHYFSDKRLFKKLTKLGGN